MLTDVQKRIEKNIESIDWTRSLAIELVESLPCGSDETVLPSNRRHAPKCWRTKFRISDNPRHQRLALSPRGKISHHSSDGFMGEAIARANTEYLEAIDETVSVSGGTVEVSPTSENLNDVVKAIMELETHPMLDECRTTEIESELIHDCADQLWSSAARAVGLPEGLLRSLNSAGRGRIWGAIRDAASETGGINVEARQIEGAVKREIESTDWDITV